MTPAKLGPTACQRLVWHGASGSQATAAMDMEFPHLLLDRMATGLQAGAVVQSDTRHTPGAREALEGGRGAGCLGASHSKRVSPCSPG